MRIRLPGVCIVCREPLVWIGRRWSEAPVGSWRGRTRHVCREDRPVCREWMPVARERCARRPGHRPEHRTAYALANARVMATGRRAA